VSTLSEDMEIAERNARRRREQEKEQNRWEWIRYYNHRAKSHARTARHYEELCDALIEDGKYER
jgi:hypothetical protein